jgi:hypothetical protein
MIYTADHPALVALKVRVHLDLPPDILPDDFVLLELELGTASVERWPSCRGIPPRSGPSGFARDGAPSSKFHPQSCPPAPIC